MCIIEYSFICIDSFIHIIFSQNFERFLKKMFISITYYFILRPFFNF